MQHIQTESFNLSRYVTDKQEIVNKALLSIISWYFKNNRLCNAMQYSLMASGKRLRPVLCMASAETVSEINDAVISASCAVEMIHTYSLIHDDLPAMDDDHMRRGLPTCHIKFDEATAILAGDALLTLAFELLSSQDIQFYHHQPHMMLQIIFLLSNAAGYKGMIEGQIRDISAEAQPLNIDALEEMHRLKTGALIEASVKIGALLAGASDEQVRHLAEYAENIGLAFQITDDILNVEGDPVIMGKAAGTDKVRSKTTYPGLIGLKQSKAYAQEVVNKALQALRFFGSKAIPLSALANYIIERKR